jgi:hypothetical protein
VNLLEPTIVVQNLNGKLKNKVFIPIKSNVTTTCLPAKDVIDRLFLGQTLADVSTKLGCSGIYNYSASSSNNRISSYYTWINTNRDNLSIEFDANDKLVEKTM